MTFNFDVHGITPDDICKLHVPSSTAPEDTESQEPSYISIFDFPILADNYNGYVVSSSGESDWVGECQWKAFDKNTGTRWLSPHPTYWENQWIQIQLPKAETIHAYTIQMAKASQTEAERARSPKASQLLGSNDGKTWTVLDIQNNIPPAADDNDVYRTFILVTSATYLYYRYLITEPQIDHKNHDTHLGTLDFLKLKT